MKNTIFTILTAAFFSVLLIMTGIFGIGLSVHGPESLVLVSNAATLIALGVLWCLCFYWVKISKEHLILLLFITGCLLILSELIVFAVTFLLWL